MLRLWGTTARTATAGVAAVVVALLGGCADKQAGLDAARAEAEVARQEVSEMRTQFEANRAELTSLRAELERRKGEASKVAVPAHPKVAFARLEAEAYLRAVAAREGDLAPPTQPVFVTANGVRRYFTDDFNARLKSPGVNQRGQAFCNFSEWTIDSEAANPELDTVLICGKVTAWFRGWIAGNQIGSEGKLWTGAVPYTLRMTKEQRGSRWLVDDFRFEMPSPR